MGIPEFVRNLLTGSRGRPAGRRLKKAAQKLQYIKNKVPIRVGSEMHAIRICAAALARTPRLSRSFASLRTDGIVECVPNFSEGRNPEVIEAIAEAARAVEGVTLLDVDPGASTHRTVFTLVGSPAATVEGALAMASAAQSLIDMRSHSGGVLLLG